MLIMILIIFIETLLEAIYKAGNPVEVLIALLDWQTGGLLK